MTRPVRIAGRRERPLVKSAPIVEPVRPAADVLAVDANGAAEVVGISKRMVQDMTQAGEIPHARLRGRVVYPLAALRRWLDEKARQSMGETGHEPQVEYLETR